LIKPKLEPGDRVYTPLVLVKIVALATVV